MDLLDRVARGVDDLVLSKTRTRLHRCFFLVHSGVSFQSVHLMHSVVWVSIMYFSPLFLPFPMGEGSHDYS